MARASILAQVQVALYDLDDRPDEPIGQRPIFEAIELLTRRSGERQALVQAAALIVARIEAMDRDGLGGTDSAKEAAP